VQERSRPSQHFGASLGADRSEVGDAVAVDVRLDAFVEVRAGLDDAADLEPPSRGCCDLDRVRGALVGMDAAERDERVTTDRIERKLGAVDAVVDVRDVADSRRPVGERDRDEGRSRPLAMALAKGRWF